MRKTESFPLFSALVSDLYTCEFPCGFKFECSTGKKLSLKPVEIGELWRTLLEVCTNARTNQQIAELEAMAEKPDQVN